MSPKDGLSKKKEASFFEIFAEQTVCLVNAAKILREIANADSGTRAALAEKIHAEEHRGDELSHKLVTKVSKSFVTPFDREDMYGISALIDDCLDGIDEASELIVIYKMGELPPGMHNQIEILNLCCEITASAPKTLAKRDKAIKEYWLEINRIENRADKVHRQLLADMFEQVTDPMYAIKLKDIIECLETTTDSFERIAEILEAIVLKES